MMNSISAIKSDPTSRAIALFAWPGLLAVTILISAIGFGHDRPIPAFLLSYGILMTSLIWMERRAPFEKRWLESDGQFWNDIGHTLLTKGLAQALAVIAGAMNLREVIRPLAWHGQTLWPERWPMIAQVFLGLAVIEFFLYWAHRLAHEHNLLWRFHALHHSVSRLWVVNTGKFHFVESGVKILGLTVLMVSCGMPMPVIYWVSALTAYVGIFTHCNVVIHDRWLSWLFNTPTLHRWHHSPRLDEGNTNYCETIMIWDLLFGTFYHPPRVPRTDIGLNKGRMPGEFGKQLSWPFTVDLHSLRSNLEPAEAESPRQRRFI